MTFPLSSAPAGLPDNGSRPYETDVVVIGAGPVGLTLACALADHGVRFRLFEQRTEPNAHSRANNVWSRPQELLASIGVRDALVASSYAVTDVNVLLDGRPLDSVPVDGVSRGHIAFRAPADRAELLAQYCQRLTAGAADVRPVGQDA